jgi:hypothetical protein
VSLTPDPGPPRADRLSVVLRRLAAAAAGERLSIEVLLAALSDRAFGALMLVFAAPNLIPLPIPGFSALTGLPLLYLSAQLALGWRRPWLPGWIVRRSLAGADFARAFAWGEPHLAKAERLLRPRLAPLTGPWAERLLGALCLLLSLVLFLPIPLGNMLPALAICLFSFGLLEKDGLPVLAGLGVAAVGLVVAWGVVLALAKASVFILSKALQG